MGTNMDVLTVRDGTGFSLFCARTPNYQAHIHSAELPM
jgi:hypothetical protein